MSRYSVRLDKNLRKVLPKIRPYTELEAAFAVACDYDSEKSVTINGYAKLWGWSRTKVNNFLNTIGINVLYAESTEKKQKQKGHLKKI